MNLTTPVITGTYTGDNFLAAYPKISDYPWQKRRDYLVLVAAVAMSDGVLHEDELALLHRWMDEFKITPKGREAVEDVINNNLTDLEPVESRLARTDLAYSLMLDMMGMAMADGVLMDDEIFLLRGVSANLNINPMDFNILIEFVHSTNQAAQMSNPEPLYEHNIQSAFALLKERDVSLFPHTLLCVTHPEYDRNLKARWANFNQNSLL